jgi:tetratricopeptide (TPR) repeat protein
MKRFATVIAVLGLCAWALGQGNDKPAAQASPSGQSGQTAPAANTPPGKRPPQAKTQPEFDAYNAAIGLTDPAAIEKAADDFTAKYPDSELRILIYKSAMQRYQQANNADKMLDMAQKALKIDPDEPEALLGVAQVLAERTRDTDLDKDQKLAESKKDAERALVTIDTDVPTSGYPPEQLAAFKGFLRSEAYSILGTISFNAKNWTEAETNLRKSIDAFPQQPDAVAIFRLAVALDMQNKIPEAIKYDDQAVDLTKDRPQSGVGKAARDEKDRLTKLNGGTAPGQTAPPKN